MGSREDRIMNLASTLKASGLAKSEVQARMMAEEMIGVEENVQKSYEEEHTKAQEYLRTAKNLGTPRFKEQPKQEQRPKIEPIGTRIQPLSTSAQGEASKPSFESETSSTKNTTFKSVDESAHDKKVELEPVHTDVNFGKGTLKDMMLNQIEAEHHEIKTIEQLGEEAEKNSLTDDASKEEIVKSEEEPVQEKKEEVEEDAAPEQLTEEETFYKIPPALDGDKLREMMEEDGPMEEHTREIKEKPKDVKPKEDYVENTVDLSNMFNVHKK